MGKNKDDCFDRHPGVSARRWAATGICTMAPRTTGSSRLAHAYTAHARLIPTEAFTSNSVHHEILERELPTKS